MNVLVKVPAAGVWKAAIPPAVHLPLLQVYVNRGTSSRDLRSKAALGDAPVVKLERGSVLFKDIVGEEFMLLENVLSLKVQRSLSVSAGGTANISLTNPLVRRRRSSGSYVWSRLFQSSGLPGRGDPVVFLDPMSVSAMWYKGILKTDTPATTVDIEWEDSPPPLQPCPLELLRVNPKSDASGKRTHQDLLEPMMKIKVFGGARFQPSLIGKGQLETLFRNTIEGATLSDRTVLDLDAAIAEQFLVPLFTGYLRAVTSSYSGGRAVTDLAAEDVLTWLDLSRININPSIDIMRTEPQTVEERARAVPQIYTTLFAGLSAVEIVRRLFVGLPMLSVRAGTALRESPVTTAPSVGAELPDGTRVSIIDTDPAVVDFRVAGVLERRDIKAYLVTTFDGRTGWIMGDMVKPDSFETHGGVGSFIESTDPSAEAGSESRISKSPAAAEVRAMFRKDRLLLLPTPEPEDVEVLVAYNRFFRSRNWDLFQSEYATRREIIKTVTTHSNSELYADGDGRVWFHPVWGYRSVSTPSYVIQPGEVISYAFTETDAEICTWCEVVGEVDFNMIRPKLLFMRSIALDTELIQQFGTRAITIHNPNIRSNDAAKAHASSMLSRLNAQRLQGEVTIVFRPELNLARNVYIPWLERVYYIQSIGHSIQWGQTATTTIGLNYGRFVWEPWVPLEYGAEVAAANAISAYRTEPPVRPPQPSPSEPRVGATSPGVWQQAFNGKRWRFKDSYIEVEEGGVATRPITNLDLKWCYSDAVYRAAQRRDVPEAYIRTNIMIESNCDIDARSVANALGLMQLLLSTARDYQDVQEIDLIGEGTDVTNVDIGAQHLKVQLDRYNGDIVRAIVAYNAGGVYESAANPWHMRMNTGHLDSFIGVYNKYRKELD